jgi:hypothetical protein
MHYFLVSAVETTVPSAVQVLPKSSSHTRFDWKNYENIFPSI